MLQQKECCGEDGENAGPRKYGYDRKYKEVERKLAEICAGVFSFSCDLQVKQECAWKDSNLRLAV
jgi:hypothetical protein